MATLNYIRGELANKRFFNVMCIHVRHHALWAQSETAVERKKVTAPILFICLSHKNSDFQNTVNADSATCQKT